MSLLCHCGLGAKVVEHHDNYRRAYAGCPKRIFSLFLPLVTANFPPISHTKTPVVCKGVIQVLLLFVQDDISCTYFHEMDPSYPQKAMDVIDDLVAENCELHDVVIEERNAQY